MSSCGSVERCRLVGVGCAASRSSSGGWHGSVCPGGVFVVGGSVFEAAVEDADEPVGEGS